MTCLVSIIIPIYNVEEHIEECLLSVVNQTYREIEIILVDDGSQDRCPEICDIYAKKDSRIRVVHKKNGGLASARNTDIDIMTGKYLFFLDSDDYIALDTIDVLLKAAKETKANICAVSFALEEDELEEGETSRLKIYDKYKALKSVLQEKSVNTSACAKLFDVSLFKVIRFPDGLIYEDFATTYRLIECSTGPIVHLDIKKYYYRTNLSSITKSPFNPTRIEYFTVSNQVTTFVHHRYPKLLKHAQNHRTRMAVSFFRQLSVSNYNDQRIISLVREEVKKNYFKYLFSRYKVKSKLYGILIIAFPKIAIKIFNNNTYKL